jgi:hypothetical protein
MIGNYIAAGKNFNENILYNVRGKANDPNPHKCAWHVSRNLISDDLEAAGKVMQATASKSRATKPSFHFSLDWHKDEEKNLTKENVIEAADSVVSKLGMEGHQALYFWHTDADHPHIHIVVNRVHDEKKLAWDLWKSKEKLERGVHEVAREMGFMEIAGRHNDMDFEPDREKGASTSKEERKIDDVFIPWVKEEIAEIKHAIQPEFYEASSWQNLVTRLESHDLKLQSKGQGLIITDGEKFMPLSKVGKGIRLKGENGLEERFEEHWQGYTERSEQSLEERLNQKHEERLKALSDNFDPDIPSLDTRLERLMDVVEEYQKYDERGSVRNAEDDLKKISSTVRRQEWLLDKAKELVDYHDNQFNELLIKIYKNPEEAEKEIHKLDREGHLKETVKESRKKSPRWKKIIKFIKRKKQKQIAKKRGIKFDKYKSKQRKQAEQHENRIFYRLQKIREAQNRIANREQELAMEKGQLRLAEEKVKRKKETERTLFDQQQESTKEVTRGTIRNSHIGWPMKKKLAKLRDEYEKEHGIEEPKKSKQKQRERDWELDPFDDL